MVLAERRASSGGIGAPQKEDPMRMLPFLMALGLLFGCENGEIPPPADAGPATPYCDPAEIEACYTDLGCEPGEACPGHDWWIAVCTAEACS